MATNGIQFWIDEKKVKAKAGLTILEVAKQAGISIPSLCHHPVLKPSGSCRLCAVEIDGYRGLPAACTTPAEEGMRIRTSTPKVLDFRREMLRLILQEHPRECRGCPRNGTCELQRLVDLVGIDFPYVPSSKTRPPAIPAGAYFERDYSLCVHCGRCVRVCHEVRGAKAIIFREINGRQEVSTPFGRPLEETGCQFCGACVDVCPVGALRESGHAMQTDPRPGVEAICDSLADLVMGLYKNEQPREWTGAICPICTAGCAMKAEKDEANAIVQMRPDLNAAGNHGQACVQGRFLLKGYLARSDRLRQPLVRQNGALVERDWNSALDFMAAKLKTYGPGEVAVLSDGRATNEEFYLLQKFARVGLRTNGVGCLAPSGHYSVSTALQQELGVVASTNSLDDLAEAKAIFAIGLNPAASHPIVGVRIRDAVMGGGKLVAANPCEASIARYADVHLAYLPDTELPLILGILRLIIDEKKIDPGFAKKHAVDLKRLRASLEGYDVGVVSGITGVSQEALVEAACILGQEKSMAIVYGLGFLDSPGADEALRALVTLAYVRGSLGHAGGGVFPAYGAGNLQGARDMGMVWDLLPGQAKLSDAKEKKRLASAWKSELDAPSIECVFADLAKGKVKALYVAMESLNDSQLDRLRPYLPGLEFVAVQDIAAPDEGFRADVVLPMASLMEKEGTITSGDRRVRRIQPVLTPPGESKSIRWVVSGLAERMEIPGFSDAGAEAVMTEIARLVPAYGGITYSRLEKGPLQWPCPNSKHSGSPVLFADKKPAWTNWNPEPPAGAAAVERGSEYPYAVIPGERLRLFHAGSLLAAEAAGALQLPEGIVMHPTDAYGMELRVGDEVRIAHCLGEETGPLGVSVLVPLGAIAVPSEMCRKTIGGLGLVIRISFAKVEKK